MQYYELTVSTHAWLSFCSCIWLLGMIIRNDGCMSECRLLVPARGNLSQPTDNVQTQFWNCYPTNIVHVTKISVCLTDNTMPCLYVLYVMHVGLLILKAKCHIMTFHNKLIEPKGSYISRYPAEYGPQIHRSKFVFKPLCYYENADYRLFFHNRADSVWCGFPVPCVSLCIYIIPSLRFSPSKRSKIFFFFNICFFFLSNAISVNFLSIFEGL